MTFYPHFPKEPKSERDWFEALTALARHLRGPEGCPWDREQGAPEFARFLQDETQELVEALASGDHVHAAEEFGDTFFNLVATAAAAEEEGRFNLEDALRGIHEKMIRRHEHVFGDAQADTPEEATKVWNAIKAQEKKVRGE